jgi:outer membrane protein
MNEDQQVFSENEMFEEPKEETNHSKKCNKPKLQTIFNIIFLIGLVACLILIFTYRNNSGTNNQDKSKTNIAFINSDTLMIHYDLFQDLRSEIETETLTLRQDLEQRQKSLEGQLIAYQKKVQSGDISYDDAQKTEQYLGKLQQDLMNLSDQYTNQIAQKEFDMSQRVFDSLNVVLKIVNEKNNYDYILGYTPGAGILYANPALEITESVVEILNERYANGKNNKPDEK